MGLIQREDVQKELGLTQAQISDLEDIGDDDQGRERRGAFENFRDMSDEERQEAFARMREQRNEQQAKVREQIADVLNSKQRSRFSELEFQYSLQSGNLTGALAAVGVDLSESDQEKLRDAQREAGEKVREQMARIQRDAQMDALSAVMDTSKVESYMGAPFTFDTSQSFGRGGGGRRGGGEGRATGRPRRPRSDDDDSGDSERPTRRRRR